MAPPQQLNHPKEDWNLVPFDPNFPFRHRHQRDQTVHLDHDPTVPFRLMHPRDNPLLQARRERNRLQLQRFQLESDMEEERDRGRRYSNISQYAVIAIVAIIIGLCVLFALYYFA